MKIKTKETIIGILILFIALTALLIQYTDYKIAEFNDELEGIKTGLTHKLIEVVKAQNTYFDSKWKTTLNPPLEVINENKWSKPFTEEDKQEQILAKRFLNNEINQVEFYESIQGISGKTYLKSVQEYNSSREELSNMHKVGTIWTKIKKITFGAQLLTILLTLWLYIQILTRKINK